MAYIHETQEDCKMGIDYKHDLENYKNTVLDYMPEAYQLSSNPDIYKATDSNGLIIVFRDIKAKDISKIKTLLRIKGDEVLRLADASYYD